MSKEIQLDEITYELQEANFMEANKQLKTLTALAKGCFTVNDGKSAFDIGSLLVNIGTPEFESIEKFLMRYTVAKDENGNTVLFTKETDMSLFFNKHRSHYYQIIFEGLKFHFLGFLPNGIVSKINTASLEEIATQAM